MHGAHWGWIALVGAIAVLFTASNHDQSSTNKVAVQLRKDMRTIIVEKDRIVLERDEARLQADTFSNLVTTLDQDLERTQAELRSMQSERDKLRRELASVSQDRQQLQQTVASLQTERSQTKRNVDQLRHGLQQLLSQADTVASTLSTPAPGFAQMNFEVMQPVTAKPMCGAASEGTLYEEEPLNDAQ